MKRVLCFGDSNTWGYAAKDASRFPPSIRWTGRLQSLLGDEWKVIEEGLNGRTTNVDYHSRLGRNGKNYLIPCIESHFPLDFIILFLGPNDTKVEFKRTPQQIAAGMEELINIALGKNLERVSQGIKILLVGPPPIVELQGSYGEEFVGATAKMQALIPLYRDLARKYDTLFVDLNKTIQPDLVDGVHLTESSHEQIAKIFFDILTKS